MKTFKEEIAVGGKGKKKKTPPYRYISVGNTPITDSSGLMISHYVATMDSLRFLH